MRWGTTAGTWREWDDSGMDPTPDPAAENDGARSHEERRHEVEVRVRRVPKYDAFMAIGAVVGAVVAWLIAALQTPSVDEAGQRADTSGVIGLSIVVGFVLGAAAGGVAALLADRALSKRARTLTAEQTDVEQPEPAASPEQLETPEQREGPADVGEAAFEPLPHDDEAGPNDQLPPGAHQQRRAAADDEPQERGRPGGA